MIDPATGWFEIIELPNTSITYIQKGKEIVDIIIDKSSAQISRLLNKQCLSPRPCPLDLPGVEGKTVHRSPHRVEMEYLEIPCNYYMLQKFITLTADVMFVNGVPFLTTLSRKIRLVTAKYLPTWMGKQLDSSLTKVVNLYARSVHHSDGPRV